MVREECLMMIELKRECLRNVFDMRGNCLWIVSFFTRAVYRVFILWCEYPTRLFSFCVYKGNEKMGIRRMMS
jgi:hypothetical protein